MLHRGPFVKETKTWLGKDKDSERDSTGLSMHTLGRYLRFKFIEGVFSSYVIWLSKMRTPKVKFNITGNREKNIAPSGDAHEIPGTLSVAECKASICLQRHNLMKTMVRQEYGHIICFQNNG